MARTKGKKDTVKRIRRTKEQLRIAKKEETKVLSVRVPKKSHKFFSVRVKALIKQLINGNDNKNS